MFTLGVVYVTTTLSQQRQRYRVPKMQWCLSFSNREREPLLSCAFMLAEARSAQIKKGTSTRFLIEPHI
jgi:putative hemolysin